MRRPLAIAFVLSAAAHAVLFAGLVGAPFVRLATSVPIELVAMKRHVPTPPVAGVTPKPTRPAAPARAKGASGPARPKPATLPAPDMHGVGPSGANLTLVLHTAPLRTSVHREGALALLALLPDYHTLLDGSGLSLFDDLSALLIATPDPRDVAATFLAARHRVDPRFDRVAHKTLGPDDPRQFRALGPDLMVLGPPQIVAELDDTEATSPWVGALRRFDAGSPSVALELTIADLGELVRFIGDVPMPRSINLSVSADASPAVHVVGVFDTDRDAQRFHALWPELQARAGEAGPMFSGVLDGVKARPLDPTTDKTVELSGTLPERQVALALSLVRLFAPPPAESVPADML